MHEGASLRAAVFMLLGVLAGCQSLPTPEKAASAIPLARIRFLLTFDDGPSISTDNNPTLSILKQLAVNDVQPGIKAVFFVQTRNANGGGTEFGKTIMRQTYAAGHILGLHSASPRGHVAHIRMSGSELNQSLQDGIADIHDITGHNPSLVRPTFWAFTDQTRRIYAANHLNMLLSDVKAHDGVIHVFTFSLRRRSHIHSELSAVRHAIERGELQQTDCYVPVVVAFHDVNTFTAGKFTEYLHILLEEAVKVGLQPAGKPFYDAAQDVERVALLRTQPPVMVASLKPEVLALNKSGTRRVHESIKPCI
jgi:hypothetical protein